MPVVWIPALLRDLTGRQDKVAVPGATVREVIERLDERYPGVMTRLCEEGRLRPNLAVVIDGVVSQKRLRQQVTEENEIHFLSIISGGVLAGTPILTEL
jgi:molybdopterin synthase sulfur carrier subunit